MYKLLDISEFDLKYCYLESCKNNWILKQKVVPHSIDELWCSDYAYELEKIKIGEYQGWGLKNQVCKQHYQGLKIIAKNSKDDDLYHYACFVLWCFNSRFKNQKEVDVYFGRT